MSKHAGGRPSKREEIKNWLLEYIAKATTGKRLATDVKAAAARNGYGVLSLKRAKRDAGIQSKKLRLDAWLWYNPFDVREDVSRQTAAVERLAEQGTKLVKSVIERDEQKMHAEMNNTGWKEDQIRKVAQQQIRVRLQNGVGSVEALDQAITFLQESAKRSPVYPAFTNDDVAQIVIEEFGVVQQDIREKAERKLSAVNSTPNPER
jgi:hypothetical protein